MGVPAVAPKQLWAPRRSRSRCLLLVIGLVALLVLPGSCQTPLDAVRWPSQATAPAYSYPRQLGKSLNSSSSSQAGRLQLPNTSNSSSPWVRRLLRQSFRRTHYHQFDADKMPVLPKLGEKRWKKYVAICVTSRDDFEEDLEEWIEYHLRIGVDVIYMVDHHSVVPKFSSLEKYVRRSRLVYHFLETPRADQVYVYEFCVHTYGRRHRWMGFIDTDEFVVIPSNQSIKAILQGYESFPGLSINWRYIGSSGQVERPAAGVLATYSTCDVRGDKHVKTFANPAMIRQITNAHYQHYLHNARAVNVRKEEVEGPFNAPPLMETMFINHYFLKSQEDWNLKVRRWRGWDKVFPNRARVDASLRDDCGLLQMPGPPWQPDSRLKRAAAAAEEKETAREERGKKKEEEGGKEEAGGGKKEEEKGDMEEREEQEGEEEDKKQEKWGKTEGAEVSRRMKGGPTEAHLTLRDVVRNTAGRARSVLVVQVTADEMDFLLNWAASVEKLGYISRVIFIAEDDSAYQSLRERWPLQALRRQDAPGHTALEGIASRNESLDSILYQKSSYILALLNLNVSVLYNSMDMVWLRDPYKYFVGDYDMWLQEDTATYQGQKERFSRGPAPPIASGNWRHQICTCFMMLRPTENAKRVVARWLEKVKEASQQKGQAVVDQLEFNKVVNETKEGDVKWAVLPVGHFPSGCLLFGGHDRTREQCAEPHREFEMAIEHGEVSVVVVHNNYVSGHSNKLDRFKEHKLWTVPDDWNSSATLSLTQIISRAAGAGRSVVAVEVGDEQLDFLTNWVASVEKQGYKDRILIIASDKGAYRAAAARWPQHTVEGEELAGIFAFGTRHREVKLGSFQAPSYKKMAYHTAAYLLALAKLQITVLYNTVDHVWLGDPYPFLEGKYDVAVHEDSPSLEAEVERFKGSNLGELITGEPIAHQLCTCLMHVRPTPGAKRLLRAWFRQLKASGIPSTNPGLAQATWNEVLQNYSAYDVSVKVLSPFHFPSGCILFGGHPSAAHSQRHCKRGNEEYLEAVKDGKAKTVIAHNNWILGHDNILQRFKKAGLWFAGSPEPPPPGAVPSPVMNPHEAFFQNVVLVINMNYEFVAMHTTRFWLHFYSRLFKHIVVICKTPLPQIGVEGAMRRYPKGLYPFNTTTWGFHYGALPRIMKRFPDAEGVLYTNDDVVINYWNFLGANKSKLWLPNKRTVDNVDHNLFPNGTLPHSEHWSGWPWFPEAVNRFLSSLPPDYQKQYFRSSHGAQMYAKRQADLFFVPRRFFAPFGEVLVPRLLGARLLSEIAIPVAFYALEAPEEWDPILDNMKYDWGSRYDPRFSPRDHWNPSLPAYHTWKVGSEKNRQQLVREVAKLDPNVRELFPSYFT